MNITDVATKMMSASQGVIGENWPATQKYFDSEAKLFAERFTSIAKLRAEGVISEDRTVRHLKFQKDAWRTVLLSVVGLNHILVEQTLNASLYAVKDIVNPAVGFALL